MEGGKEIGEGSSRRKRHVERRSSRRRVEEPPVEEEVPKVAMGEEEEEGMAPVMNVEEERKKRAKTMKTVGDAVHCRFLPLLEDLGEVGGYAWGAAFLAHHFDGLSASERQTSTSGFYPFLQVWAYLHLPALGRGDLSRPGLVPIARRWDSRRDTRHLEAIDSYPYVDARPYFGRSVWLHALNLVLPLNLFLTQHSLGLRKSVVVFPVRDRFRRLGQSFRGLHDTTNWRERAREQIENWKRKGKGVDVTSEIASLRALLQSARSELERVRGTRTGGASSSRSAGGSPSLMEARLAGAVLRAEEAQRHLEERERDLEVAHEHAMELQSERDRFREEAQTTRSERDQLRIRA
ncbi:hypothetical protein Taro_030535 [Colocasia esculenta]|uniref:Aminotransferase-like plant mobile domain-containing protein n=1 Tax=Colocasia esculenta TaxID=4460 RepID=A0A843VS66_COLES|nr:hypothetical protein [Colocasia esculenta]